MPWTPPSYAKEVTPLTPQEETNFWKWVNTNKITDVDSPDSYYDYRGYYKQFGDKPVNFGVDHFPDTYKQHGHPTFSIESKYSTGPEDGGSWNGETYIPQGSNKSLLSKIWDIGNTPLSTLPSKVASSISEPLMSSGEMSDNLLSKIKLYGGAFAQSLGDVGSSLTNPINLGLLALSGGSSLAEKSALPLVADALEFPGKAASVGMLGHGGYQALNPNNPTSDRLAGVVEALLGGAGMRDVPEMFTRETPKPEPFKPPSYIEEPIGPIENVPTDTKPFTPPEYAELHPVDKLKSAIKEGTLARETQDKLYSQERSQRIAAAETIDDATLTGYYKQLGMLKGDYPKVPLKSGLEQTDVDHLIGEIHRSELLKPFEKINAKTGLVKLLNGEAPQPSELRLMTRVFGDDLGELVNLHGGFGAVGRSGKELINDTVNVPKSLMATMDLSAPLRQGLPLISTPEYWRSFKDMFSYFGDKKAFDTVQEHLANRPNFELGEKSGLHLSNLGDDLHQREEAFLSKNIEKVPIVGKAVQASERAYVGFLNKLRADTFDSLVAKAKGMGHVVYTQEPIGPGLYRTEPTPLAKSIAHFVNTSTGRGHLGRFEKNAVELNAAIFSPRMIASRLTMLNPKYYMDMPDLVRRQALRALFSVAGAGLTVNALASAAGAKVSLNPTSSDFLKPRFGRTRLDPFGGFQQYIVAATRLIKGESTSTTGRHYELGKNFVGPTRASVITDFARSKESPIASFIDTMLQGKQAYPPSGFGNYVSPHGRVKAEIINRYTPMILSDLVDIYQSDPTLLPLGILGAFGMGLQTFGKNPPTQPKQGAVAQ